MLGVPGDSQRSQEKRHFRGFLFTGLKDDWLNIALLIFKGPHPLRPQARDWRGIKRHPSST